MNAVRYVIVDNSNGSRVSRDFDRQRDAQAALTKMHVRFGHVVKARLVRL